MSLRVDAGSDRGLGSPNNSFTPGKKKRVKAREVPVVKVQRAVAQWWK